MSNEWVIGRFIESKWQWLSLEASTQYAGGQVWTFTSRLDEAYRFYDWFKALGTSSKSGVDCVIPYKTALSIEERWKT